MDAVISFPKSGRTWLRVMLDELGVDLEWTHASSGHRAGCHLNDLTTDCHSTYDRILFLHRDPRDTAVSGYYQKSKRRFDGYDSTISEFLRSPNYGVEKIIHFNKIWNTLAAKRPNMKVVTYENLKKDAVSELADIMQFFGREADREKIHQVVEQNRFERMQEKERSGFFAEKYGKALVPSNVNDASTFKVRRGVVGGYRDELSAEDVAYCDRLVEEK